MEKNIDYDEILARIGYFRNKANLSARETSFRLDKGELYLTRIENKQVELKVSTLLNLMDIFGITAQDFFYLGKDYNEEDKNILDLYSNLSKENKQFVIDFIKKLK
ncbi:MAG: helix-turn-helix transcriptional regulator [Clostridiales bacterium]|nr:helix-turn-helix transcriptional regulator [Clostridiales bacterium]